MSKRKLNAPITFTESFQNIDKEKGILYDVVICQEGEAKGHGVLLDKEFIANVVSFGQEWGDVGVKSRFGHPNMCSEALGTYLGRFKNFRLIEGDADKAIADLYLDESSKITPNGNLQEYILKLAETSPDKFGNSIVFESGDPKVVQEENEDGEVVDEKYYATIVKLWESDLVDSPAATESLFSQFDSSELAYNVTTFLESNKDLFKILEENPEVVNEFFEKYKQYKEIKMNKNTNSEEIKKELSIVGKMLEGIKSLFDTGSGSNEGNSEENNESEEGNSQLEEMILCPLCDKEFNVEGLPVDENGNVVCPHCGGLVNKEDPAKEVEQPKPEEEEKEEPESPELSEAKKEIEQLNADKVEANKEIETLKGQLSDKDKEIEGMKSEFSEIKTQVEKFKEQLSKIESTGRPPKQESLQASKETKKTQKSHKEVIEERINKTRK